MDKKHTCNPTSYKMDDVSWSPRFWFKQPGCLCLCPTAVNTPDKISYFLSYSVWMCFEVKALGHGIKWPQLFRMPEKQNRILEAILALTEIKFKNIMWDSGTPFLINNSIAWTAELPVNPANVSPLVLKDMHTSTLTHMLTTMLPDLDNPQCHPYH